MSKTNTSTSTTTGRAQWGSSFGFVMAAAGSAIGLGNLWKFPYVAGQNGGAIFLIIYIAFTIILGIPIMLGEMSIGRKTRLNPIGAYEKLNKKWKFVGVIGVTTVFIILSYYSVVGGWIMKYVATFLTGQPITDSAKFFTDFTTSPTEPVLWHIAFMTLTILVVVGGVTKGIERVSKIMLPSLLVLIIGLAIYSATLPNAIAGIKYFLVPDLTQITSLGDLSQIVLMALGQVFFSLSVGIGSFITYGSYLKKDTNLQSYSVIIPALDTLIAVLAGFAILPAVFSLGLEPTSGPSLIFVTLPAVFSQMSFGGFVAIVFFVLVFFAAITSSISMLEVVASYFIDKHNWSRKKAVILMGIVIGSIGCLAAVSDSLLADVSIAGMNLFDSMSYLTDKILMPLGAFLLCIFIGHIYGVDNLADEISNDGKIPFKLQKLFSIIMKYVAPIMIIMIFITSLLA